MWEEWMTNNLGSSLLSPKSHCFQALLAHKGLGPQLYQHSDWGPNWSGTAVFKSMSVHQRCVTRYSLGSFPQSSSLYASPLQWSSSQKSDCEAISSGGWSAACLTQRAYSLLRWPGQGRRSAMIQECSSSPLINLLVIWSSEFLLPFTLSYQVFSLAASAVHLLFTGAQFGDSFPLHCLLAGHGDLPCLVLLCYAFDIISKKLVPNPFPIFYKFYNLGSYLGV